MPKLVIFKGENVENETRLAGRPVRLGRDNRNDIVLDDKSVSRFHAEVRPDGDKYIIVDLKSRNGVWVNGQQIKGKTALALGAPVTLGAFEVTLEDDVPTGEFDEASPLLEPRGTMVNPPTDQSRAGGSQSATRPSMKAQTATNQRQMALWGGAAVAVLLICGVTFAVIRYRRPAATVEVVAPPPAPPTPTMPTVVTVDTPANDPTRATIDKSLEEARAAAGKNDYAAAREHVARVLELDPANQAALDLKKQIEAGARTAKPRTEVAVVTPPPPPPAEIETPGIPRRPGEVWPEYLIRVQRIDVNLKQGKSYVDKKEFPLALARFRLVAGDQKGYQDVEALITDTLTKQRMAVDEALENGLKNEQQARWVDAMKWYQAAQAYDPAAANVRQRMAPLTDRLTKMGIDAIGRAEVFRKRNDNAKAIPLYKDAVEMLPRGHEKSLEAQKWLETLKP